MHRKRAPRPAHAVLQFLDGLMDTYTVWRDESRAVTTAYHCWNAACGDERAPAYRRYVAALDREENAARAYQRLLERGRRGDVGRERWPVPERGASCGYRTPS